MGLAELGQTDAIMARIETNFIDSHVSYVYEDVCKQKLWEIGANGAMPFLPEKVGRYWDKNIEIDAVALSETENSIMFCECKFWKGMVGINVLQDLEEKASKVTWGGAGRKTSFGIFSISGFTKELQEVASARQDVFLLD
jgi:hypothetical protein